MSRLPNLTFFSGRSNLPLAKAISGYDGIKMSKIDFCDFANGEMKVRIAESVRGEDVFILQTSAPPCPEKWMMELFIMCHTIRKSSARRITVVIPYIYGSRQDRKTEPRTPITIQLIADLLNACGVRRIITVSLHNQASIAAFGDILVDNISSSSVFYPVLHDLFEEKNFVVVSPDAGGVARAQAYSNKFGTSLAFAHKTRQKENQSSITAFVGDVKDRNVLIVDDIVDTGGTHIKCAEAARENGALNVYLCVTHPVLSRDAVMKLEKSCFSKIYTTDSISHQGLPDIFQVISLGALLGDTIVRVNEDKSVGALFEKESGNGSEVF